jgi:hypothetical protein
VCAQEPWLQRTYGSLFVERFGQKQILENGEVEVYDRLCELRFNLGSFQEIKALNDSISSDHARDQLNAFGHFGEYRAVIHGNLRIFSKDLKSSIRRLTEMRNRTPAHGNAA